MPAPTSLAELALEKPSRAMGTLHEEEERTKRRRLCLQEPHQGPLERSGMRWTEAMAEAIVKLRAIYLSGDLDRYWSFNMQRDQERLHPAARWSVVEK